LCGGSRFLENRIQIRVAEVAHLRRTRSAHAPAHIDVGGYMRGERKEGKKRKKRGRLQKAAPGASAPSSTTPERVFGARAARLVRAPPR
jgi:hypothetical protein